tara:strand:- start:3357 stop:3572 length:216 start_codon:yes stop_codon:yes gene_type:complete
LIIKNLFHDPAETATLAGKKIVLFNQLQLRKKISLKSAKNKSIQYVGKRFGDQLKKYGDFTGQTFEPSGCV